MTRPKLVVINSDQSESRGARDGKRYRFELSRKKLIFCATGYIAALLWMFIFGILIGRGVALVSSEDFSLRAEAMRFLGLDRQTGQPSANAGETWGDPRKMLESLNYYEDLTRPGGIPVDAAPKSLDLPPITAEPAKEPVSRRSASEKAQAQQPSLPPQRPSTTAQPEKSASNIPPPAVVSALEQYTLLVASLKDPDNAQRLVDQLNSKGYKPRLESLDLNGGGRWNRVLVGTFQSREAALRFAAEFNKKEKMEGLVIREPN